MYVVEWSRALDVRLSEWCCSVSMLWVQIHQKHSIYSYIYIHIYIIIINNKCKKVFYNSV